MKIVTTKFNAYDLATFIMNLANSTIQNKGDFYFLLSGGTSILPVLNFLVEVVDSFENWIFVVSDERDVHPSSELSNTNILNKILGKVEIVSFYHKNKIDISFSEITYTCLSRIDFTLLGVGEDGHIASIFSTRQNPLTSTFLIENAPKLPPRRISITLHFILKNCHCVHFLVLGDSKKNQLTSPIENPFQYIYQQIPNTIVYTD